MKAILSALALTIQEIKTKSNAALAGMLPLDQYESKEVSYAVNTLEWVQKEVEGMQKNVADVAAKYDPEVKAAAEAMLPALLAEKVAAGEYIAKSNVEAAVAAAEIKGRETAEAAYQLREQEAATIAARRKEIETSHGVEVAASIPDDVIQGENFEGVKTEVARRVAALQEIGVTAAKEQTRNAFGQIACGHAFDEEGNSKFDAHVGAIKSLVPASGTTPPTRIPGSGPAPAAQAAASLTGGVAYGF